MLSNWNLIELDFQRDNIDIEPLLDQRTWRWFNLRLAKFIGDETSHLHRALIKKDDNEEAEQPR